MFVLGFRVIETTVVIHSYEERKAQELINLLEEPILGGLEMVPPTMLN
jgi:hypothetical protein